MQVRPLGRFKGRPAGFVAEELQVVPAEDGEMVARPQRVVAALGHVEAEPRVLRQRRVEPVAHGDDHVVDGGGQIAHGSAPLAPDCGREVSRARPARVHPRKVTFG